MLQSEFTTRTGIHVTADMFEEIHKQYMASELDKDTFCSQWKRKHMEQASNDMVQQIYSLQMQLAKAEEKRVLEREHANKELLEALNKANAYADELIRIYDIKGDYKAIHALFAKLQEKYNH